MSQLKSETEEGACCRVTECSVSFYGAVDELTAIEIVPWLSKLTDIPFTHIKKKAEKQYGYIHFPTQENAARFYFEMHERTIGGPKKRGTVRFGPGRYRDTKEPVKYIKIDPDAEQQLIAYNSDYSNNNNDNNNNSDNDVTSSNDNNNSSISNSNDNINTDSSKNNNNSNDNNHNNNNINDNSNGSINNKKDNNSTTVSLKRSRDAEYGFEEDNNKYCILLITPGIKSKAELNIFLGDDYRSLSVCWKTGEYLLEGLVKPINIEIDLPSMIDPTVNVEVGGGITTIFLTKVEMKKRTVFLT